MLPLVLLNLVLLSPSLPLLGLELGSPPLLFPCRIFGSGLLKMGVALDLEFLGSALISGFQPPFQVEGLRTSYGSELSCGSLDRLLSWSIFSWWLPW